MKRNYFILFLDCVLTKGAVKSTICDLSREQYIHFENCEEIQFIEDSYIVVSAHNQGFVRQLEEMEYGFFSDVRSLPDHLPKHFHFEEPRMLSNIIIDVDKRSHYNIGKLMEEVSRINVFALQIRFFSDDYDLLKMVLSRLHLSALKSIEVLYPFIDNDRSEAIIAYLQHSNSRVSFIAFYNAPVFAHRSMDMFKVIFSDQFLLEDSHCGFIHENYFIPHLPFYTESLHYNNCLNKKISVDKNGIIKNCPYSKEEFGHIDTVSLKSVLGNREFLKYWKIKKDDVAVCRQCEFRYMCSDCRFFTQDHTPYSKPAKCTYDPLVGTWMSS